MLNGLVFAVFGRVMLRICEFVDIKRDVRGGGGGVCLEGLTLCDAMALMTLRCIGGCS